MTQSTSVGQSTGGKPINLEQLQRELVAAGVECSAGLGIAGDYVFTYDAGGQHADFAAAEQPTVDEVIAAHTAMRDKTNEEYAAEFQDANTSAARKQQIRDITGGLLPREQVPSTA